MTEAVQSDWMPEPALWTKKQAAHYLGISVGTVQNLLRRRELIPCRIGGRCLIRRATLENFIRRNHETESQEAKEERRQRRQR